MARVGAIVARALPDLLLGLGACCLLVGLVKVAGAAVALLVAGAGAVALAFAITARRTDASGPYLNH